MSFFEERHSADDEGDEYVTDKEEDSTDEEDDSRYGYNPSRPAYLQLLATQYLAMADKVQCQRQPRFYFKKNQKPNKKARTITETKHCCLGGYRSKTDTHHNNFNDFDCGFNVDQPGSGIVCDCGLSMCYQCIHKNRIDGEGEPCAFSKCSRLLEGNVPGNERKKADNS